MYETTSTPNCTDVLTFQRKVEKAEFHPHAVVINTKESCCCCPGGSGADDGCCGESSNVSVIPRYKITDFRAGSGRQGLSCKAIGILVAGVCLIILGSYLVAQGPLTDDTYSYRELNRYTDDIYGATSTTDSDPPSASGIILILLGIAVVAAMVVFIVLSCCKKEHYYVLQYSNGRSASGYSFFSTKTEKTIESNDKPNEEFLYNYVYDTIEKANDPSFLHRFSHLNHAGLMEANKDKATPNELRTVATGDAEPVLNKDD